MEKRYIIYIRKTVFVDLKKNLLIFFVASLFHNFIYQFFGRLEAMLDSIRLIQIFDIIFINHIWILVIIESSLVWFFLNSVRIEWYMKLFKNIFLNQKNWQKHTQNT